MEKTFRFLNGSTGLLQTLLIMQRIEKVSEQILKNMRGAANAQGGPGSSNLGLGQMPRMRDYFNAMPTAAKVGVVAAGATAIGMGMMPNTGAAVTQRMAADAVAGISGLNARQVILRSNKAIGGGATSAMGPTMATMALMYGGGYTATSGSFKNVMGQVGGLSALTGSSNEQVAAGLASINAMRFLRIGVQARDNSGNLKPPSQIINDTYRFLYGGRKITPEQAAMVLNPNSKGYATISAIAGGDANLMGIIQMGIIARARQGGKKIGEGQLKGSDKALDMLGVGKESPIRSQFRYETSEARKLQATEKGLVGGYNVALRTTASVNDGFSRLAEEADLLTQAFAGLRGAMQTFPAAGNTGKTLSGLVGGAAGFGMDMLQLSMMMKMMNMMPGGVGAGAKKGVSMPMIFGNLGKKMFGRGLSGLKFAPKSLMGGLGRAGLAAGAYLGMEKLQGFLNQANVPSWLRRGGNVAFDTLQGGVTGFLAAGPYGAAGGAVLGGGGGIINPYGQGGDGCGHGNIGAHACGKGGDNPPAMSSTPSMGSVDTKPQQGFSGGNKDTKGLTLQMPVPRGTLVTSPWGPRDNSKNPKISSYHRGIDYGVSVNTPVMAAADGVVTHVGLHNQYGRYVIINHGKKSTLYAHLNKAKVRIGDKVAAGTVIALSGGAKGTPGAGTSTGPHLHFEVRDPGGVGAQGRENPRSWFGRLVGTVSNLFKKVKNLFGFGKGEDDSVNPRNKILDLSGRSLSTSNLSSLPLSQSLSSALMSGSPIDFASFKKEFPADVLEKGVKNNQGRVFINTKDDMTSGDKNGTLVGGSRSGLMNFLRGIGFKGKALETAFAVALAESGGTATSFNGKGVDESYGLFQINMKGGLTKERLAKEWKTANGGTFKLRNKKDLFNPKLNAQVAYHMTARGTNWEKWGSFTDGRFTKFLDDAYRTARGTEAGVGGDNPGMAMETVGGPAASMGRTAGGTLNTRSTNVVVNIDLNVNVARMGTFETQRLAANIRKSIEEEFKLKGIAGM